jgi:2-phosphoglycerate kinase
MLNTNRNWDILLIGGASGSGKTSISYPLSRFYGIDLVRVDDFQVLLEKLTTPESFPSIHYWNTHPEWYKEGVDSTIGQIINVGRDLIPGLVAVINDHIVENIPMILEGDFILPELPASFSNARIKSVFIYEHSKEQILQNYLERDKEIQEYRADVSYSYGNWLIENCSKYNVPIVESRPWNNLMERVIERIN